MAKSPITYCDFEGPTYLFFGADVPPLVYYSHLPIAILAVIFAVAIYFHNKRSLANKILFWTLSVFALWVILDSIFWASNRTDVIMFVWSVIVLIEPIVHIGSLYLLFVLIEKKDIPFGWKILFGITYLPLIIFAPTSQNLIGFDISTCLADEGPLALYYSYLVEITVVIAILTFSTIKYLHATSELDKKRITAITLGIFLFLLAFSWGNIIGSLTDDWQLAQYGLFGMPVFIGFLIYSIVKFQEFKIKLIGSVALVLALLALISSLLFVQNIDVFRVIVLITLGISAIFGALLIKSIKNEIEHREKIEKLATELEKANIGLKELDRQKDAVLHIVAHQLKGPVTTINFTTELLLDGSFGELSSEQKENVTIIRSASKKMGAQSEMVLDASKITSGKLPLEPKEVDLNVIFKEAITEAQNKAKEKRVHLNVEMPKKPLPKAILDQKYTQIAIDNLLSNAIKYTALKSEGGIVNCSVEVKNNILFYTVKDNGVGIPKKDQQHIFKELYRSSNSGNDGNGLGLHITMGAIKAQGGKIRFESEEGKGATFFIELPLKVVPRNLTA